MRVLVIGVADRVGSTVVRGMQAATKCAATTAYPCPISPIRSYPASPTLTPC